MSVPRSSSAISRAASSSAPGCAAAYVAPFGLERGQLVEAEDLSQRRRLRLHRGELLALRVVLGEREHRLGVGEDVLRTRMPCSSDRCRRRRRRSTSSPSRGAPTRAGCARDRDGVAAADTPGEQRVGERVDALAGLLPRDLAPAAPLAPRGTPGSCSPGRGRSARGQAQSAWRQRRSVPREDAAGVTRRHQAHRIAGRELAGGRRTSLVPLQFLGAT